jgi:hypothetical protein
MSSRISAYWTCQLIGWGSVMLYWLYYEANNVGITLWVLSKPIEVGLMIAATDVYRRIAHRKGWIDLHLLRLLPRVSAAFILLTFVYLLMGYVLFHLRFDGWYWGGVFAGALGGALRYNAIWLLAFHLYHFSRQTARARTVAVEMELSSLVRELNPHFLFNSLNGIKALTREDPARARSAIDRLSGLLRGSIGHGRAERVAFREERAIADNYLFLEKIRLENRLRVNWQLDRGTEECYLPPFSLHTLLENAVKHGISPSPVGGEVTIRGEATHEGWWFTVINPGRLKKRSGGTGLRNLRRRLRLAYGGRAVLEIGTVGAATRARLFIPRQL